MKGLVLALFIGLAFSGCIGTIDEYYGFEPDDEYRNPGVFNGQYRFANPSLVVSPGPYAAKEPELITLISDLPAYPGGTQEGEVDIRIGLWLPQNYTDEMPLIIDAGPYYEIDTRCDPSPQRCAEIVETTVLDVQQTTEFSLRNFLPHGYAVAQIGIRGTGGSGGCMDLLGPAEQHDLNQAINYLASQPWSNGNVGMIGVSYDGSTPWLVAASGNPHLKTIVPISGIPSLYDLLFYQGSAETRGPVFYHRVYWPFGFSDSFPNQALWDAFGQAGTGEPIPRLGYANGRSQNEDLQNVVCPAVATSLTAAATATVTGADLGAATPFWAERDYRQRVLDNYEGSVFLIHGLQDWNVDPHVAIPFNQQLREAGIPLKEWYGQWDHANPDSRCSREIAEWITEPCRLDYAEVLYRWFETYLNDNPVDTGPEIQVQDNVGFWRNAESFPDTHEWRDLYLHGGALQSSPGAETQAPLQMGTDGPTTVLRYELPAIEEELRLTGMPELQFDFQSEGLGGFVGAWLLSVNEDGLARAPQVACFTEYDCRPVGIPVVGHGQLNLNHATGEFSPNVPFQKTSATMVMEPLDVVIPPGDSLELWVFQYQYPDHYGTFTPGNIQFYEGTAALRLPVHEVNPRDVFPVPGAHMQNTTVIPEMYVLKPNLPAPLPNVGGLL